MSDNHNSQEVQEEEYSSDYESYHEQDDTKTNPQQEEHKSQNSVSSTDDSAIEESKTQTQGSSSNQKQPPSSTQPKTESTEQRESQPQNPQSSSSPQEGSQQVPERPEESKNQGRADDASQRSQEPSQPKNEEQAQDASQDQAVQPVSPHYLQNALSVANSWYNYAKSYNSRIEQRINQIEVIVQPITYKIADYGKPIVESIDERVTYIVSNGQNLLRKVQKHRELSFEERRRIYIAATQAWIDDKINYQEFIEHARQLYGQEMPEKGQELIEKAYNLWSQKYKDIKDVTTLTSALVAEQYQNLQDALTDVWKNLQDKRQLLNETRQRMADEWLEIYREKVKMFQSIASLDEEIKQGIASARLRAQGLMKKAQEVAQQTSYVILATANDLYDWSVVTLDSRIISRFSPPKDEELELHGTDRLISMNIRMEKDIREYLKTQKDKLVSTDSYKRFNEMFKIEDRIVSIRVTYDNLKQIKREDIMKSTLPNQLKERLDEVLQRFNMKRISTTLQENVWEVLDEDNDGVITVEDVSKSLYSNAKKYNPVTLTYQAYSKFESMVLRNLQIARVNGENQDI